jgi:hypothetical protein
MAQAISRHPLTAEARVRSWGQSMWDLWWTKWHWDRFFSEYFSFPLSISFQQCSIKREKQKKKPSLSSSSFSQGYTISLMAAVRP